MATFNKGDKLNNLFIPFSKKDDDERMVYGYASTEALDSQNEKVAKTAIEEALPDYMKFANIREMHQPSAVGKAQEATIDDKGLFLGVKVVDESAWQKVKEGVYNGFSIGGKIITKVNDTITKLKLSEISLVDRPANPEAVFSFYKGDDMVEEKDPKDEKKKPKGKDGEKPDEEEKETEDKEAEKADNQLTLLKGFVGEEVWDASVALQALDAIMYLLCKEIGEDETMPEQTKALQDAVKALKAFIVSEIQEDNGSGEGEAVELSDKVGDIAKAGASISKTNKQKLQSIMEMCKEMMGDTEEEAEKSVSNDDLAKGKDLAKSLDIIKAENVTLKDQLEKMQGELTELKSQPEPPKGKLFAIGKGEDVGEVVKQEAVVLDHKGEVNEVASMIKSIHTNPIQK